MVLAGENMSRLLGNMNNSGSDVLYLECLFTSAVDCAGAELEFSCWLLHPPLWSLFHPLWVYSVHIKVLEQRLRHKNMEGPLLIHFIGLLRFLLRFYRQMLSCFKLVQLNSAIWSQLSLKLHTSLMFDFHCILDCIQIRVLTVKCWHRSTVRTVTRPPPWHFSGLEFPQIFHSFFFQLYFLACHSHRCGKTVCVLRFWFSRRL